jgi:N-acetylmuramoyl-L-alanine amidase
MTSAIELLNLAGSHVGESYILGAFAPKDNAQWKGPWDCAEFASWVAFQSTGLLMGCTSNAANPALADAYSGAWARDAAASDRKISIGQAKATAGAVLIRKPPPKGIGHVAISLGDGTTVEAHSAKLGVTNQVVDGRRWDAAMLLPLVDYPDQLDEAFYSPPSTLVLRLTMPPMHGALVKSLQKALKARGLDPGEIDGIFGPHTEAAVRGFQLQLGLVPDGEAGKLTLGKLGLKP